MDIKQKEKFFKDIMDYWHDIIEMYKNGIISENELKLLIQDVKELFNLFGDLIINEFSIHSENSQQLISDYQKFNKKIELKKQQLNDYKNN